MPKNLKNSMLFLIFLYTLATLPYILALFSGEKAFLRYVRKEGLNELIPVIVGIFSLWGLVRGSSVALTWMRITSFFSFWATAIVSFAIVCFVFYALATAEERTLDFGQLIFAVVIMFISLKISWALYKVFKSEEVKDYVEGQSLTCNSDPSKRWLTYWTPVVLLTSFILGLGYFLFFSLPFSPGYDEFKFKGKKKVTSIKSENLPKAEMENKEPKLSPLHQKRVQYILDLLHKMEKVLDGLINPMPVAPLEELREQYDLLKVKIAQVEKLTENKSIDDLSSRLAQPLNSKESAQFLLEKVKEIQNSLPQNNDHESLEGLDSIF